MPFVIPAAVAIAGAAAAAAGTAAAAAGITTGILGVLGTSALFGLTTVGGLIGFVATAASSLLSVAFSGMGDSGGFSGPTGGPADVRLPTQTVQATVAEPARARWFGHGKFRSGGALIFWDTTEPDGGGDLWRVVVFDCRQINRITGIQINGEPVQLDNDGFVTSPQKWAGNIQIITRNGTADQSAIAQLVAAFPGVWTEAHRGRGLALAAIRQKPVAPEVAADTYPRGALGEQVTIEAERALIWDPRDGQIKFSENAALHALDWILNSDGFAIPSDELSLETWKSAANQCDEGVLRRAGISTPRYRCAGVTSLDKDRASVLQALLDNCDAALFADDADGGRIGIRLSHPDPDPSIGTIRGHHVLAISDGGPAGAFEEVRAVRSLFVDPERGYNDNTTPSYPPPVVAGTRLRAAAEAGATALLLNPAGDPEAWFVGRRFHLDGLLYRVTARTASGENVDVTITPPIPDALAADTTIEAPGDVQEIDRPYCPDWGQAMRLDKKAFLRLNTEPAEINGTLALLEHRATDTVYLGFPEAGRDSTEPMRVEAVMASEDAVSVTLLVSSIAPDYDDWSAQNEEAENALPPVPEIEDVEAEGVKRPSLLDAESTNGSGSVRIVWKAPPEDAAGMQVETKPSGSGDYSRLPVIINVDDEAATVDLSGATGAVDIRTRWATSGGAVTQWSNVLAGVDPFDAPAVPPTPTLTGPGTAPVGQDITLTVGNLGPHSWRVNIYIGGASEPNKTVSGLGETSVDVIVGSFPQGLTRTYEAGVETTAGLVSSRSASVSVTTT